MSDVFSTYLLAVSRITSVSELDCLGCLASCCVLLTFCMQGMFRLRAIALLSNVAFIAYGYTARLVPILVLHCILLVINSAALARLIGSAWAAPDANFTCQTSRTTHPHDDQRLKGRGYSTR